MWRLFKKGDDSKLFENLSVIIKKQNRLFNSFQYLVSDYLHHFRLSDTHSYLLLSSLFMTHFSKIERGMEGETEKI